MLEDAVSDLKGQVETSAFFLQHINDPYALIRVRKGFRIDLLYHHLTTVSEGRMSQIVSQGDGLGQILIQS